MSEHSAGSLGAGGKPLRTIDCVAQSLAVGPIFSAAALGAALAGLAGGVGPFVILLTFIGVLGIGWSVSEYAKRYSGSGTVYELIAHGFGKRIAVWSAGAYHTAVVILGGPAAAIIIGITAQGFFAQRLSLDVSWWVWSLIAQAIILSLNLAGVRASVKTQLTIIGLSLIPFAILIVVIIAKGGVAGNSLHPFDPGSVAQGGSVFKGLLFAILMFVGFELAAALGEETENPRHSIPRAVVATVVIVAILYMLTQYVGAIGSGGPHKIPFEFDALGQAYVGKWLSVLIDLAILFDTMAVAIGFQSAGARGLFTLARDHLLPHRLSHVSKRGVPSIALVAVSLVSVLGILGALADYGSNPNTAFSAFLIGATVGGMLISGVYFILCLGAVGLALRDSRPVALIAAIVGLVTSAGGVISEFIPGTAPTGDARYGRDAAIAVAILLTIWLTDLVRRRAEVVETVGQHAVIHEQVEPGSMALPQVESQEAAGV